MYKRILVPLENGPADGAILSHVTGLAKLLGAEVVLVHVADGWAARNMEQLNLRESQEMKDDRAYLERMSQELRQAGVEVDAVLAAGDPAKEIAATAEREQVDLIAMATHGHSLLSDVVHGTTATALRHVSRIPILMVRAPAPGPLEWRSGGGLAPPAGTRPSPCRPVQSTGSTPAAGQCRAAPSARAAATSSRSSPTGAA